MRPFLDLIFKVSVSGLGSALIFSLGWALAADEFKRFGAAKVCFYLAAAWLFGGVVMWSVFTTETAYVRLIGTFLAFGIIGVVFTGGVRVINRREAQVANQDQEKPDSSKTEVKQETRGDNSPNVVGDHNTINYNQKDPALEAKLDEITKLLKQQGSPINKDDLLKKYPLGYVIFDLDHKNHVVPYQAEAILDNYEIDWTGVRVEENAPGRIVLHMPSLKTKNGSAAFTGASTGGAKRVGNLGGAGVNGLMELGEILAIGKEGIVFLVGFQKAPVLRRR
jgi:hypothetical protein